MAVSHKHRRSIKVAGREYLWQVKYYKRYRGSEFPTILEIIDPDRRVKKIYGPLSRLRVYEWSHQGHAEPTGPWPEESLRLMGLGAKTINSECTIVITPRIVSQLIKEDFDLTAPPVVKRRPGRVIRPPRHGNGKLH